MNGTGITVLGASTRSMMLYDYLKDHPESGFVTGVYDPIPGKAAFMIEKKGLADAVAYESVDQAVSDKRAQTAFVVTTDCGHAECSIAALDAGLNVFCEKPMAITLEDCDAMIAAGRKSKGVFYVGMNMRHAPVHQKLHEILMEGKLGKVLTIEANEYYKGGRTYFNRWNRLRKYGGGLWLTKACHDFDLLNWFAGGNVTRVYATSSLSHYKPRSNAGQRCRDCLIRQTCPDFIDIERQKDSLQYQLAEFNERHSGVPVDVCLYNSDKDTFDNGIAVVDYDNDIRATYTCNVVSARSGRQMRVMGTEGAVEGDTSAGLVTYWKRFSKDKEVFDVREKMKSGHGGADGGIMVDFFHCCRTGERPRSSWAEGRACVQVGLAARESCDTGRMVALAD